jgi:hypothetical protein
MARGRRAFPLGGPREVFARVRSGDARVADLYAEDGVIIFGSGDSRVQGREAIRAFYQHAIDTIRPQPRVLTILEQPPLYVATVDVPAADERRRAVDLFEVVGEQGIHSLEIYFHG